MVLKTSIFHGKKKSFFEVSRIFFYLAHHDNIVPRSRSVIHSGRADFDRGQQNTGGALLREHRHAGEQVGRRAEQGELDRDSLSAQPAL